MSSQSDDSSTSTKGQDTFHSRDTKTQDDTPQQTQVCGSVPLRLIADSATGPKIVAQKQITNPIDREKDTNNKQQQAVTATDASPNRSDIVPVLFQEEEDELRVE